MANIWTRWKCYCDFTPAESHLDDGRRILLSGTVHWRLSIAVFDVGASLAFLQQLLHARRVASLTCQVQRRLTWCIPSIDLTRGRKMTRPHRSFCLATTLIFCTQLVLIDFFLPGHCFAIIQYGDFRFAWDSEVNHYSEYLVHFITKVMYVRHCAVMWFKLGQYLFTH